jgi:hypothetical protein
MSSDGLPGSSLSVDVSGNPELGRGDGKVPAKRGRKKKEVVETDQEPKIKKKRGRKAALKFFSSSIRKKIPISFNTNSSSNVILHLDVNENMDIDEDNQIEAYEINENPDSTLTPLFGVEPEPVNKSHEGESKMGYIQLFEKIDDSQKWPQRTDLYCWWCCHQFDTVPIGLPIDYRSVVLRGNQTVFKVKGNFCSTACVLSWYNNSKYIKDAKIFTLIKFMNKKLTGGNSSNLIPAPPRETLRIFGGDLTINEFREKSNNGTLYKMINYPMIVIKEFIEEIDLTNLKIQNEKQEVTDNNNNNNSNNNNNNNNNNNKKTGLEHLIASAKTRMTSKGETVSTENTIDKFLKMKLT